jgi:hypothetical protein
MASKAPLAQQPKVVRLTNSYYDDNPWKEERVPVSQTEIMKMEFKYLIFVFLKTKTYIFLRHYLRPIEFLISTTYALCVPKESI